MQLKKQKTNKQNKKQTNKLKTITAIIAIYHDFIS